MNFKIEVIGSGCPKCKKLFELTIQAVKEMNIQDSVEYSTDVNKIIAMEVMQSPVLAINGKPVLVGLLPDKEKIKQIISKYISGNLGKLDNSQKSSGCSCGGKC